MSRRRNPRLKKAHKEIEYSQKDVQELMKCARDPKHFIKNYIKIKHPKKGKIKFNLYDYQEDMIDLYDQNRFSIVMSARQTGKTETICAYLLWYAIFNEDVTVMVVSNKSDNAKEIIGKIQYAYEELPDWLKPGIDEDSWNKHECKFDNSSRIIATTTSADSGRGYAISLLYCDEYAFVKSNVQEEFWTSILPTISCLRGDTILFTQNGLKTIESLCKNKKDGEYFEYNNLYTWGLEGREKVSHGYVSPASNTKKIKNKLGMEVEATLDHKFWVAGKEAPYMKKTSELTLNDYIKVDSDMNMWGNKSLDDDLAYMLGGYIAEGWSCKRGEYIYGITISNTDDEFRNVFLNSKFIRRFSLKRKNEPHKLDCFSRELVENYENLGVDLKAKCYDKKTPSYIMESDKNTVCNYLAGLFDGDGAVTDRSINLTSTSKRLIKETQLLLLNMGLISRVYTKNSLDIKPRIIANNKNLTKKYKNVYSLNIPLSQYYKFKKLIPIKIKRKIEKLNEIIEIRRQDDFKQFTIPAKIVEPTIKEIVKLSGLNGNILRKKYNLRLDKVVDKNPNRVITHTWLVKLSEIIKIENHEIWKKYEKFWKGYLDGGLWVQITELKNSFQQRTYDLTVPTSHSFLQSGFMGSNTGGSCIISSTPNGNSNLFAELWRGAVNGINDFKAMHVPWYAPPERDEEFKKQQIGALGKRRWLQEFECQFLSSDITLIDSFILNQIENEMDKEFGEEPPIAFTIGDLEFFKKINKSLAYIVSVDVASGNGNDYSVIEVTEFPTLEQVLEFRSNNTNEKFLYSRLKNILLFLQQNSSEVYFSVENNGLGASILALYEYDEKPPETAMLISDSNSKRLGISMSETTKRGACMKLKHMIENRTYKFYSKVLLREFKGYTRQGSTYKAETGSTDDCIAALLILMRILQELADHNPYAYDQIYNVQGQDNQQNEWDEEFTDDPKNIDDMAMPIIIA
jgi:hypothetical protein